MARLGEEFPLVCPGCGGEIRLIAFITEPEPIRKKLTHLGHPDTFPTLEMSPYPLPRILFTTPFVHGLPVRVGRPSAFNASHTC